MKNLYGFEGAVDVRLGKFVGLMDCDADQVCETLAEMLDVNSEDEVLNLSLEDCFWRIMNYVYGFNINRELLAKKIGDLNENDWMELFDDNNAPDFKVFRQK